ncbi:MAG: lipase [Caulobacter sp. 12-67-6]|mgnify:CR=1 FL=1|nr:MAG: lipase [Caulobacter sp. 12-67-6]OYX72900.1 MAG: lipase [Caulobacter sp. 32-67-35]OYX95785.1 MAG: lipase [Caulobacter sp. 35-67-4]OZA77441.1 MAG: lipase [Caulobacter sp. 39-67-4]HQR87926.1 SGNH/GDSL hydrolase family protein [Caulobacter sp.]
MRSILLALVGVLSLSAAPVAAQQTALTPHIGGRVAPAAEGGLLFGWPGVYFEGRFSGPSVTVAVDSGSEHLTISIDGQVRAELLKPGLARLTFDQLAPGEHVVRLDKLTESQTGRARFVGFFVGPEGRPLAPVMRPRRIEFIGDSYTVAYGVRSNRFDCTEQQVHDLTDTSQSFAPVLAGRLNADYRIIAFSGRGVVRNYSGLAPGEPLPALYSRLIPGQAEPRVDPADPWRPDLIVVGLGTNDFSTPLKADEGWKTEADLRADYRDSYVTFVAALARRHPQARFLLIAGDTFADDVEAVVKRLNGASAGLATAVRITGLERTACHGHPSAADGRMIADRLEAAIQ